MKSNKFRRSRIAIGVLSALGLIGVANSQPAAAQESMEEITVTGIRGGLQNALDVKRDAQGIVDAVSAEDVGKFPDQNLAESLQRITGVQITRSEGEGKNITVRGLPSDFTRVQFNGRTMPSVNATSTYVVGSGGRSFDFTIIPSSFVREIVVHKTSVADIEEGGISGTADIKTIRPLDMGQRVLSGAATGVYEENSGETQPKVNALYSDSFNDGKFGVALGAHYDKRSAETHAFVGYGAEVGVEGGRNPALDYNLDGDFDDTFRFHHENRYRNGTSDRERKTLLATLQFQPTDNTDFWFETLYSEFAVDNLVHQNAHRFTNTKFPGEVVASNIIGDPTGDTDGFANYLDLNAVDVRNNTFGSQTEDTLLSFSLGGSIEFGEWTAEVEASLAEAEGRVNSRSLGAIARMPTSYDFRGIELSDIPPLAYASGFDPLDPEHSRVLSAGGRLNEGRTDENADLSLDFDRNVEWSLGNNLTVSSLEFGAKFSSREKFEGVRRLDIGSEALAGVLGKVFDPTREGGFTVPEYTYIQSTDNFLDAYDGPRQWPDQWLNVDTTKFAEDVPVEALIAAGRIIEGGSAEYKVIEDVAAAYAKLNFEGADGRFSGNLGVRYVETDQESNGFFPDKSTLVFDGGGTTFADSSVSSVTRSYSNVLPSFNAQYSVSDDVIVRFGAARVMTRPTLQVLSPSLTYNVNTRSINSNNPEVDPFTADQLDVSFEWYYADAGFMSFAPFMKNIDSFIVQGTTPEQVTYYNRATDQTATDTFTRFSPVNGVGSKMFGYEMNWIQPLDFIVQGLGFQTNFTYVDASDVKGNEDGPDVPLTGLSRTSYNLIGFYENDKFGARLAYNYRDEFVINPTSYFGDGQVTQPYDQLDLQASYNVNDNITVVFEATNLMESTITILNSFGLNRGIEDVGRRMTLGVRMNF